MVFLYVKTRLALAGKRRGRSAVGSGALEFALDGFDGAEDVVGHDVGLAVRVAAAMFVHRVVAHRTGVTLIPFVEPCAQPGRLKEVAQCIDGAGEIFWGDFNTVYFDDEGNQTGTVLEGDDLVQMMPHQLAQVVS